MISTFHKDHPEKSIAILLLIDFAPTIAKLIAKLINIVKRILG